MMDKGMLKQGDKGFNGRIWSWIFMGSHHNGNLKENKHLKL